MKLCKSENEFIAAVAPVAQSACARLGTMLSSVIVGQACLEVGYSIESYFDNPQVPLLIENNNLLGMKSALLNESWADKSLWNGKSLTKQTPEVYNGKKVTITDNFRIYESVEQCFMDYILFLLHGAYTKGGTPKYGRKVTDIKDPETLIKTINQLGYATNPNYWKSVMSIIKKHNLTKYDNTEYKEEEPMASNIKKVESRTIKDVTAQNKSQVPKSRGSNKIQWIVAHYLGVKNADNENLYGGGYGGHYYVSRYGQIYKAADPKTAVVWHCGGKQQGQEPDSNGVPAHRYHGICTNNNSIGIECGVFYDTDWWFSTETQESLVYLVSKLMDEYGIDINYVIRHFDVSGKNCPFVFVQNRQHNTSWTWDEFINNLKQYRKDGTITIPDRSKNPVTPSSGGSGGSSTRNYLMKGDNSEAVKTMQKMLLALNYDLGGYGADGKFGSATDTALRAFQKDFNLTVDGKYGNNSKSALEAAYAALTATIKRGDKGDAVKKMQEMLITCKCLAEGEADGDFGPKTEAAVKMAQYILLGADKQTGIYDATTKAAVEKCYAKVVDTRFIYKDTNFAFVFDPEYYNNRYADLNEHYHGDVTKLFNHFIKYGTSINEKRQGCADFNVEVYAKNYPELLEHYKNDWFMLYRHYCKHGWHEGRKGV